MSKITKVQLRTVFTGKGDQNIACDIQTKLGSGTASVPKGTSAGKHEVNALPQKPGKLISQAQKELIPKIRGVDVEDLSNLDATMKELDGTLKLSKFGGNVILAISIAALRAKAFEHNIEPYQVLNKGKVRFPRPIGNVIGGGSHAFATNTTWQEFQLIPNKKTFFENVATNVEGHKAVGKALESKGLQRGLNWEGAWTAKVDEKTALSLISKIANEQGSQTGVDIAATEFYNTKKKSYKYFNTKNSKSKEQQYENVLNLVEEHGLYFVEDPFEEDDFETTARLTKAISKKALVCGDDLFTTNSERLRKGIKIKAANAIIIKPNQVGTVTDAVQTAKLASKNGLKVVVSHRSSDNCDNFISHLALGVNADFIKTGVIGGERVAKLNELIRLEQQIRR